MRVVPYVAPTEIFPNLQGTPDQLVALLKGLDRDDVLQHCTEINHHLLTSNESSDAIQVNIAKWYSDIQTLNRLDAVAVSQGKLIRVLFSRNQRLSLSVGPSVIARFCRRPRESPTTSRRQCAFSKLCSSHGTFGTPVPLEKA